MIKKNLHLQTRKSKKSWLFTTTLLAVVAGVGTVAMNEEVAAQADTLAASSAAVALSSADNSSVSSGAASPANASTSLTVTGTANSSVNTITAPTGNVETSSSNVVTLSSVSSDQPTNSTTTLTSTSSSSSALTTASTTNSASTASPLLTASTPSTSASSSNSSSTSSTTSSSTSSSTNSSTTANPSGNPSTYTLNTTSAEDLDALSGVVHEVGQVFMSIYSPGTPTLKAGDIFQVVPTGQEYQVLSAVDSGNSADGYPDDGLQAMAVSPIVNGQVDLSRVIIAYAGTDFYDTGLAAGTGIAPTVPDPDVSTDLETVVGGSDVLVQPLDSQILPGQAVMAKKFADSVIAQYPNASYVITGLSLGGYLAMAVGAEEELPVYCFSGDDPSNILTASEINYVRTHPNLYFDITDTWDTILGAYGGNNLDTRVYYDKGFTLNFLSAHMATYSFNANGAITDPTTPILGSLVNTVVSSLDPLLSLALGTATDGGGTLNTTLVPVANDIYDTVSPTLGGFPITVGAVVGDASAGIADVFNALQAYGWAPALLAVPTKIISTSPTTSASA